MVEGMERNLRPVGHKASADGCNPVAYGATRERGCRARMEYSLQYERSDRTMQLFS
jgi:hypothetical protein